MSQIQFLDQKRTQKRTENERFEKGEFVGFALNEQKKEIQKNYKEILKNHPEIYELISENEKLKKENNSLLEENISHGEKIESLENELNNNSRVELQNEVKKLEKKLCKAREINAELIEIQEKNKVIFDKLKQKYIELEQENENLNQQRKILEKVKDKGQIYFLQQENKELKQKLQSFGRSSITDAQIRQIIDLHNNGFGYDKISDRVHVAKSTVHKYVHKYLQGKLNLLN